MTLALNPSWAPAYIAARKRTDRDPCKDKERFHVTLLAMNNQGFENLWSRLASEAEITGNIIAHALTVT